MMMPHLNPVYTQKERMILELLSSASVAAQSFVNISL
jgi:hypothetical protein